MIMELGPVLTTWQTNKQVCGTEGCGFSILYSGIRKKYYASHEWHPFPTMTPLSEHH
jgi:hypothetical protein